MFKEQVELTTTVIADKETSEVVAKDAKGKGEAYTVPSGMAPPPTPSAKGSMRGKKKGGTWGKRGKGRGNVGSSVNDGGSVNAGGDGGSGPVNGGAESEWGWR